VWYSCSSERVGEVFWEGLEGEEGGRNEEYVFEAREMDDRRRVTHSRRWVCRIMRPVRW
jgi:hypothetical protein